MENKSYEPIFTLTRNGIAKRLGIDARTVSKYFDRAKISADVYLNKEDTLLRLYYEKRLPEFRAFFKLYKILTNEDES